MEQQSLLAALRQAGCSPVELVGPAGGSAIILPYGARLLALFTPQGSNLFWVNPCLRDSAAATAFFRTTGWRNTGGDRTWISPERDLHIADLDDPWNSYQPTPSIDPGAFTTDVSEGEVRLATRGQVTHQRLGRSVDVNLEKRLRLVPNPLRHDPAAQVILGRVGYVGYEQMVALSFAEPRTAFRPLIGLWDAIELPAPGEMLIPTTAAARVRDFFEPTGTEHLIVSDAGVRFVCDAAQRHKIAVRGTDLPGGRAAYFSRSATGADCTLVVRNFALEPSGEYMDTPWDDPQDRGYVLECYNDSGINGCYAELEYHSPAIGEGSGLSSYVDRAQLWGFEGPEADIAVIMRKLLGKRLTGELFAAPCGVGGRL